ncbi:MAG: ABC transporter substrate-binding protein [Leucobacter sp.]
MKKIRFVLPALAAVAALALAGCTNSEGPSEGTDTGTEATAVNIVTFDDIKAAGVLVIATDAEYPPNEYKDEDGNPTGWGVELANAIAEQLGVEPEWEIMGFDGILPRIEEGVVNMGASSFTDNAERQKTVDFVNFLNAGSQWAAPVGANVDPENACGLTVAVQQGTVQHTDELPAKSKACTDAGEAEIVILPFDGQPEVTNAVIHGQADAFSADSPVTGDAVAKTDGQLELAGEMFDAAPYGFAVQKGSGMAEVVRDALQALMDNGTYLRILTEAGVDAGALDAATINAGS